MRKKVIIALLILLTGCITVKYYNDDGEEVNAESGGIKLFKKHKKDTLNIK